MALAGQKRSSVDSTDRVPGYQINSKVRHNFQNKSFNFSNAKQETYLDLLIKQKQKIPSPDKYALMRESFVDPKKQSKIYTADRGSTWNEVIKKAKLTPASNFYDKTQFDEKRMKPPRGYAHNMQTLKYSFIDEAIFLSKQSPSFYDPVKLVSFQQLTIFQEKVKKKDFIFKIRPESEVEHQAKHKKGQRTNAPSPVTYQFDQAMEKTSRFSKAGSSMLIGKDKKKNFCDIAMSRTKYVPGVGKYNPQVSIDKCSRPMKSKGY